jgi:GTP-binding protein HflX
VLKKLRLTYPHPVEISAKKRKGLPELIEAMAKAIASLQKTVKLKVPQSHYALVSQLMKQGRVLEIDYEGNNVLMEVEIPASMEKKVQAFV